MEVDGVFFDLYGTLLVTNDEVADWRRWRTAFETTLERRGLRVHDFLADAGVTDAFDEIVISGKVGHEKPDPAIFRPALEALGLRPEAVLHVGDSAADIHGARAAVLRAVHIQRDGEPPTAGLDGVSRITRLAELFDLLEQR